MENDEMFAIYFSEYWKKLQFLTSSHTKNYYRAGVWIRIMKQAVNNKLALMIIYGYAFVLQILLEKSQSQFLGE